MLAKYLNKQENDDYNTSPWESHKPSLSDKSDFSETLGGGVTGPP